MTPHPQRNKGWRQFALGMVLYALIVVLEGFWLEPETLSPALGVLFALLPMVPAVWAMLGWLEAVRTYDELQRRIFSEAGLLALGLSAAASFSYGFLEVYLGAPRLSMFVVWPFIAASYALALPLLGRRYR